MTEAADGRNEPVLLVDEREDRIIVSLNRPAKRNAINLDVVEALHRVCDTLERDPRVLLLAGIGQHFAAGADIRELSERGYREALAGINSSAFARIRALPMPTIALVRGYTLGGGAELAYACDFRIGTLDTTLGNPEVGLGIVAAAGAMWRLKELVGEPLANEMLLAGRMLTGAEATAAGLLTKIVEPDDLLNEGHLLADRIGRGSLDAVRLTKLVLSSPAAAHPAMDNLAQALLFTTPEKTRRISDFLEGARS